jgi:hypothetical protein
MAMSPTIPEAGQIVRVRQRLYVVEQAVPPCRSHDSTLVKLSCIDDDAQGQPLEVLWERELDPEIVTGEAWDAIAARGFDQTSALLEILDPQRFCRGVSVPARHRDEVLVRRLKEDIREIQGGFPKRSVVQIDINGLPEEPPSCSCRHCWISIVSCVRNDCDTPPDASKPLQAS